MKLATLDDGRRGILAAQLASGEFVDLARAAAAQTLEAWLPPTLMGLLHGGPAGLALVAGIIARINDAGDAATAGLRADRIVVPSGTPLLAPVPRPGLIVAAGAAYRAHAAEMASVPPLPHPMTFTKAAASVTGHNAVIHLPSGSATMVDYEGELACVIGRPCFRASPAEALDAVAGYTAANDVSARDWLGPALSAPGVWEGRWTWEQNLLGKQFPGFTPLGPVMTTADEIGDPAHLTLTTRLNGREMQRADVADLIFSVGETIAYYSRWYAFEPGDVVLTGTPAGVGAGRRPPVFMAGGDTVEVEVSGVGTLRNTIAA